MNKKHLKTIRTSRKLSEKLHKLNFKMPASCYWIKTLKDDRFNIEEIKGEFYFLPTTKVYPAYSIDSFFTILEQIGYDFRLTNNSLSVGPYQRNFRRDSGTTLVDLVASAIITLIESKQIVAE